MLTDQVSVTLAANRFVSTDPNCPKLVDSLGTTLALSDGLKPQTGAANVRGGERGVEPGVQPRPVRDPHRHQHPADRLEPAA